jgi:hypothetical protein
VVTLIDFGELVYGARPVALLLGALDEGVASALVHPTLISAPAGHISPASLTGHL